MLILNGMYLILKVLSINLLRYVEWVIGLRSPHLNARHPLRWMASAEHNCSDAGMGVARAESVCTVALQLSQYQFTSRCRVLQCLGFPYLSPLVLHHLYTLPCPSVRMWLYWFVAISGCDDLGGVLGIDIAIGQNLIIENIIGYIYSLTSHSTHLRR